MNTKPLTTYELLNLNPSSYCLTPIRYSCSLVTFYFTHKYLPFGQLVQEDTEDALNFVDDYGSYLDLYKSFVVAGKLQSQSMIIKLVGLAKFDPQHREAMKGLQKAKVLLFYEPVSFVL